MRHPTALLSFAVLSLCGSTTLAQTLPIVHVLAGLAGGDRLGSSVRGGGDVDADGLADYIVGIPGADPAGADSGAAIVLSGATGLPIRTFNGLAAGDAFGSSVDIVDDVNGDGYAELLVGAPGEDSNGLDAGRATLFDGQTGNVLYAWLGLGAGDRYGTSVSAAGDVNGDTVPDIVIGAPLNDNSGGTDAGFTEVRSGASGGVLWTFNGIFTYSQSGISVAGAGDVNADGYGDVIVGAWFDSFAGAFAGSAIIYSGADGSILRWFLGVAAGDLLGVSVGGAGDVNMDGYDDVIIGASASDAGAPDGGQARVFSGLDGQVLWTFTGQENAGAFGLSVAGVGDVNGDGVPDLAVGAPREDVGGLLDAGRVHLFSGATGSELLAYAGNGAGGLFGASVGRAGDVNGDGLGEIVMGAPQHAAGAGFLQVALACGAAPFGIGQGSAQTLTLGWFPNPTGPGNLGWAIATGATPLALGLVGVGAFTANVVIGNAVILIDLTTPGASFFFPLAFDGTGQLIIPADLRAGPSGFNLFIQVIEIAPGTPEGFRTSNGLDLFFCD